MENDLVLEIQRKDSKLREIISSKENIERDAQSLILEIDPEVRTLMKDISKATKRKGLDDKTQNKLLNVIGHWRSFYSFYNRAIEAPRFSTNKYYNPFYQLQKVGKKPLIGKVISDGMIKSRVVLVDRQVKHEPTGKLIKKKTKFMVHDSKEISKVGDQVVFYQTRPISKRKTHKIYRVL